MRIVGGLIFGDDRFAPGVIETSGSRIAPHRAANGNPGDPLDDADAAVSRTIIDAGGLLVAPGFIDLQINGGHGLDLTSDPEAMWQLGRLLPQHGVTSFLPTIVSAPPETRAAAIDAVNRRPVDFDGAEPLGLHFEGPMLNPARRGAHSERYLTGATTAVTDGWSAGAGVLLVTIAPELPGSIELIAAMRSRGVVVSGGHTTASADEAARAVGAGMTMVTHLFNAMEPLGHRRPNLVGYVLGGDDLVAGLIVDGVHVDPLVVATAWRAKGPHGLVLVTDAVAAMGRPPGRFDFGRRSVTAGVDGVRYDDGTLAGSNLTLDAAVRNLVAFVGCGSHDAISTVTTTPASVLGLDRLGRLSPGARADIVLLTDDLSVAMTICGGRLVYCADQATGRISG